MPQHTLCMLVCDWGGGEQLLVRRGSDVCLLWSIPKYQGAADLAGASFPRRLTTSLSSVYTYWGTRWNPQGNLPLTLISTATLM